MKAVRNAISKLARSEIVVAILRGLVVGALIVACLDFVSHRAPPPHSVTAGERSDQSASAALERLSPDARTVVGWISATGDASGRAFVIVDKKEAMVHVFDVDGRLRASAPVLLGAAIGDDTVAGIGQRAIADVRPEERTTPAGRFVGERGHDARGEDVVWVDYDAGVSMHRVITSNPSERRLERLATPTSADNRISYGCINVPTEFYESYIRPTFAAHRAIVYVLPEVRPVAEVFGFASAAVRSANAQ